MVEDIITALSRIRWLFVIARNSSFTYKGQAVDVKQVGRELGVRYVLEGSVRKSDDRVRITSQLIDAEAGTQLWADRFDGALVSIFDLQDKVASSVAGIIEPALQAAETARLADRPTNDLTAYDLYLRAYAMVLSSAMRVAEALSLLEQAIERDPRYGPALGWAAYCCLSAAPSTIAAKIRRQIVVRVSPSPGLLWKLPETIQVSWRTPPSRWLLSAKISAPRGWRWSITPPWHSTPATHAAGTSAAT